MVFSSSFLTRSLYVFLPHTCHISAPSHHPNNIWLALQTMQLLIMQLPSVSLYFPPSRPLSPSASHFATHSAYVLPLILESKLQTAYDIPRLFICCWFIAECSRICLELRDMNACKFNFHCTRESFMLLSSYVLTGPVNHWCCFVTMY